jgi:hypothetical protein
VLQGNVRERGIAPGRLAQACKGGTFENSEPRPSATVG